MPPRTRSSSQLASTQDIIPDEIKPNRLTRSQTAAPILQQQPKRRQRAATHKDKNHHAAAAVHNCTMDQRHPPSSQSSPSSSSSSSSESDSESEPIDLTQDEKEELHTEIIDIAQTTPSQTDDGTAAKKGGRIQTTKQGTTSSQQGGRSTSKRDRGGIAPDTSTASPADRVAPTSVAVATKIKKKGNKTKARDGNDGDDEDEGLWGPFHDEPMDEESFDPESLVRSRVFREADPPEGLLMDLLPFQKEFLAWAIDQEKGPLRGGILADEVCIEFSRVSFVIDHRHHKQQSTTINSQHLIIK